MCMCTLFLFFSSYSSSRGGTLSIGGNSKRGDLYGDVWDVFGRLGGYSEKFLDRFRDGF